MKPIIGLVGPSGSGKTTLIMAMLNRFPNTLTPLKSLTTRPAREEQDKLFYNIVTKEKLRELEHEGKLIQVSEYAGNLYANDTEALLESLNQKAAIGALVEDGVRHFTEAGFNVITIKVIPEGAYVLDDTTRLAADTKRAEQPIEADFEIINSFDAGGLKTAITALAEAIEMINQ